MLYEPKEISKISQNLSLRLSPERKYCAKYICCSICSCDPCICCSICHYLPCRCCRVCHCTPCKCVLHYSPIRCCSPCRPLSPCRVECPKVVCSPIRSVNCYTAYEEKQFNDFLKKLMNLEGQIETAKINLALNPDFNCEDAFGIFECNGRGFLDACDLKHGLNALGIFPTEHEIRLLIKRFDLQKAGTLNYSDFFDMIVPFEKEYRTMVENRCPNSCCLNPCPDIFCFSTQCALKNLFNLIINTENEINNNRKLFGSLKLKLRDIFGLLDYLRKGYFTNSDLIVYLQNRGLLCSNKDADLLFIRLDKNRCGKIYFCEVDDEIQTLY